MGSCHRLAAPARDRRRVDGLQERPQVIKVPPEAGQACVRSRSSRLRTSRFLMPIRKARPSAPWQPCTVRAARRRARPSAAQGPGCGRHACGNGRWPWLGHGRLRRLGCASRSAARRWGRRAGCRCGAGPAHVAWGSANGLTGVRSRTLRSAREGMIGASMEHNGNIPNSAGPRQARKQKPSPVALREQLTREKARHAAARDLPARLAAFAERVRANYDSLPVGKAESLRA